MANETAQEKALKAQYQTLRELLTAAQYYAGVTGEPVSIAHRTQRLDGTAESRTVVINRNTQISDVIDGILTTRLTQRNQVSPANLGVLTRVRIHELKNTVPSIASAEEAGARFTRALRDVSDMMSSHTSIQSVGIGQDIFSVQQLDAIKQRIANLPVTAEPVPAEPAEAVAAAPTVVEEPVMPVDMVPHAHAEEIAVAPPTVPEEPVIMPVAHTPEMALSSETTLEEIAPHVRRKEDRLKAINDLYATMDGLMYDLQAITSDTIASNGLVSDAQFNKLLVITRGLRELTQQEVHDQKEGRLAETGHIRTGLIGFSGVLNEAVKHMDDSPASLPQKHVLESMAQMLEFGRIPTEERLNKAWQEGKNQAMNVGAFRGNFLGAINHARQDPQMLFSAIFDLAKMAGDTSLKRLSVNYPKEFNELKILMHELGARYSLRNERDAGMHEMLDHLGDLRTMLTQASRPDFSIDADPMFFKNMILQVRKTKNAYDGQLEAKKQQLAESYDNYVNFADNRDQGLRKWLEIVIDEANAYHPIFSVTHTPCIYHEALLHVMHKHGLATDTLTAPTTKKLVGELDHYLRTGEAGEGPLSAALHEYELTSGLKEGDLLASGADALQPENPYRLLSGHEAYFPDGNLPYDAHSPVANSAEIIERGAATMQPDILDGEPTTNISGATANEVDRIIAEASKTMKIQRGADALRVDGEGMPLYAEDTAPDTFEDREAERRRLKQQGLINGMETFRYDM